MRKSGRDHENADGKAKGGQGANGNIRQKAAAHRAYQHSEKVHDGEKDAENQYGVSHGVNFNGRADPVQRKHLEIRAEIKGPRQERKQLYKGEFDRLARAERQVDRDIDNRRQQYEQRREGERETGDGEGAAYCPRFEIRGGYAELAERFLGNYSVLFHTLLPFVVRDVYPAFGAFGLDVPGFQIEFAVWAFCHF